MTCKRCGKTTDENGIHTCTPPEVTGAPRFEAWADAYDECQRAKPMMERFPLDRHSARVAWNASYAAGKAKGRAEQREEDERIADESLYGHGDAREGIAAAIRAGEAAGVAAKR